MRVVKQFLIMMFVIAGMSLAVAAQKDPPKQDKPKPKPPVIKPGKPGDKPPRPPKEDKPKKPGMAFLEFKREYERRSA